MLGIFNKIAENTETIVIRKKVRMFAMVIIMALLVISTLTTWYITKSIAEKKAQEVFNQETDLVENWIANRLTNYKTILYGYQAYWEASGHVTRSAWDTYSTTLNIETRYPGITSINFLKREGDKIIVTYAYPKERQTAEGTNIAADPKRLEVAQQAIDSGRIAITDKINLFADQKPGFAMYAPLYSSGGIPITLQEKRTNSTGLVVLALTSDAVFKDIFETPNAFPQIDFELYSDNDTTVDHLLYDHDPTFYIQHDLTKQSGLSSKRKIIIGSQTFTLITASKPGFGLSTVENSLPMIVLIGGGIVTLLYIYLFWRIKLRDVN